MSRRFVCAVAVLGWPSFVWAAGTLYEQPRIEITGSNAIGIGSTRPADAANEFRSRTFDNFTLSVDSEITSFSWVGAFSGPFNPDPDPQFRSDADFAIEIFANSPAHAPDVSNSRFFITLDAGKAGIDDGADVSSSIIPGVSQQNGGVVLNYMADVTPFTLDSGTYWLSVESYQNHPSGFAFTDPDWLWVRGLGGDGQIYSFDEQFGDLFDPGVRFSGGCPSPCDAAFSLIGNALNLSGDYDGSGTVEQKDLDLVLLNWGQSASSIPNSWVNDFPTGLIDQPELDKVLLNWADTLVAAGPVSVPEPGCFWLAFVSAAATVLRSRAQRHGS